MASSDICNCTMAISQLFLCSMLLILRLSFAQLFLIERCDQDEPIKNGSAMEGNLKVVLNSLVDNVNKTGYNISSYGENGDKMYGLSQCRGDLNASACRACVSDLTNAFPYCGSIYDEEGCFLTSASHNFYSEFNLSDASSNAFLVCDNVNVTINGTSGHNRGSDWSISPILTRLMENAVSSGVGYSTRSENGVYSLAQCRRDLSVDHCKQCLNAMYNSFGSCPSGTNQGDAVYDKCMISYAKDKFYGDGVPLLSPPSGSGPITPSIAPLAHEAQQKDKGRPKMLALSIGGAVTMVVLVGVVIIGKRKVTKAGFKKQLPGYYNPQRQLSTAISKSKLNYKFQNLQAATKNFNPTNKIGQGGFGSVYKGVMPDGREIAVKRLFSNREESVDDFFNEVNLISCVQHKNLVKLLGCSVDGPDKLLVYEYLPNKSLDHFLFDENMGKVLDWHRRFEIILGTASGLAYLHQESDIRIIHRDIKASNILLDHHFKPKIADFGLIRYFADDQTHLSTGIAGTRGYMAPEYLVHGHLTEKVDVYAFGVLVLEIISGRRNMTLINANGITSLLKLVWNCHLSGTVSSIIDPNIQEIYQEEVLQVVHMALLCTQASATLRPSMPKVIMFLTNKSPNLPEASQPLFIDAIHLQSNISSSVALSHSKSNTSVALNHSHSNPETSVSPTSKTHNPVSKITLSSTTPLSLNTISTCSFGPR